MRRVLRFSIRILRVKKTMEWECVQMLTRTLVNSLSVIMGGQHRLHNFLFSVSSLHRCETQTPFFGGGSDFTFFFCY